MCTDLWALLFVKEEHVHFMRGAVLKSVHFCGFVLAAAMLIGESLCVGEAPSETAVKAVASVIECVPIAAGHLQMHEGGQVKDVVISEPFHLGKTEVTQSQFRKVMGTEPWINEGNVKLGDDYPAVVRWQDATDFCEKLTAIERGSGAIKADEEYRLPTEAEWEYACRAGETAPFASGEDEKHLGDYAWFEENARSRGEHYAHKVGTKKPNAWGLHDMHGNVPEWCSDYSAMLTGGVDPAGPESGTRRVFRGGGWWCSAADCKSESRGFVPSYLDVRLLGFRAARSSVK